MAQLYSKVQVAAATKHPAADVIFLSEEAPSNIVAANDMMPLDSLIAKTPGLNLYDIQRLNFWKLNGKTFGITTYLQLVMLDYNAARLQQAGFTSPPTTWRQLGSEALTIKHKKIDTYPISMAAIDWSWYLMALSMGDPMFDRKLNPTFSARNAPARQAMRLLVQYYKEHLISPSLLAQPTPHTLYESGVGTFHQSWEGALAVMDNPRVSKQAPNVRYMLLPERHYTWGLDAAIGLSAYTHNQDAAWRFVQWYLQPAQQTAIYTAYGLIPSRGSVQRALDKTHAIQELGLIDQQSRYVHQLPRYVPWWGSFTSYVTQQVREAFVGRVSPDRAIDYCASQWTSLRSQYQGS
jgi:ABC-type glycerol-3-phosphate transport system substrate-binding protein